MSALARVGWITGLLVIAFPSAAGVLAALVLQHPSTSAVIGALVLAAGPVVRSMNRSSARLTAPAAPHRTGLVKGHAFGPQRAV